MGIMGGAIALLFAGNIFFIKRLIDKVEKTEEIADGAAAKAEAFEKALEGFVTEIKGIRADLKSIYVLDKQLGKLEVQLDLLLKKDGYFSGHG